MPLKKLINPRKKVNSVPTPLLRFAFERFIVTRVDEVSSENRGSSLSAICLASLFTSAEREVKDSRRSGMSHSCFF